MSWWGLLTRGGDSHCWRDKYVQDIFSGIHIPIMHKSEHIQLLVPNTLNLGHTDKLINVVLTTTRHEYQTKFNLNLIKIRTYQGYCE